MRFALFALAIFTVLPVAAETSPQEQAYAGLKEYAHFTTRTVDDSGCVVQANMDFGAFVPHLREVREAWLNKDYSFDFYNQHRKHFFAITVIKRYADEITESLDSEKRPRSCSFAISVTYPDKYGQNQTIQATTWKFDRATYEKINWDRFDPRDFSDVAIDYKNSNELDSWLSDEPTPTEGLSGSQSDSAAPTDCDMSMLRADAIFIRATTWCSRNYLDTPAGYYALAITRQCGKGLNESQFAALARSAMVELDTVVRKSGRTSACHFVDAIEAEVMRKANPSR